MGKGANAGLLSNSGTAQQMSSSLGSQAQNLYGSLVPGLTNQSINPQGYDPTTLAKMRTSALQTAGGSAAGGVGAGRLYEMRTRNAGAAGNAIASASQAAGETLGKENLGIDVSNAKLKQQQQSEAQHELGSIYSTDLGASLNALGLSNQALGTENQYKNPWLGILGQGMQGAGALGAAAIGA